MKSFNRREGDTRQGKRRFNTATVDPGRQFAAAHDMKAKDELNGWLRKYGKLKEPWVFVAM